MANTNTVWNKAYRGVEITRYRPVFFENTDIPGRTVFQDMRSVHRVSGTVFVRIRTSPVAWKIRCQDKSLKRGVWRPGNFLILSDLPQIMAYRIRARGQSNCVFLKIVFSTVRTVSLSILVPKFHSTRQIDMYSRTRFSTALRESRSI